MPDPWLAEIAANANGRDAGDMDAESGDMELDETRLREMLWFLRETLHAQRRSAEEASQERARLNALLSAMDLGILFLGNHGRVIYSNPALARLWHIPSDADLAGLELTKVFALSKAMPNDVHDLPPRPASTRLRRQTSGSREILMQDGRVLTELLLPVQLPNKRPLGSLLVYEDVTRARAGERQLTFRAERDGLTGLCNRYRFEQELQRMAAAIERHGGSGALLYFDLDGFKAVNDSHGHGIGDTLLISVATAVSLLVRRDETFCRLGGDEFSIILPKATQPEAEHLAERIVGTVRQVRIRLEEQEIGVSCSLGIAMLPRHTASVRELLPLADDAMYRAKRAGKNTWRMFHPEAAGRDRQPTAQGRAAHLAQAIENNQLRLHFQGVYDGRGEHLSHLEALLRLYEPAEGRIIPPAEFIPYAESSGQMQELDRWVLLSAVQHLAAHQELPALAVKLSVRSVGDVHMPGYIADLLRQHGVAPCRLIVELAESAAVSDLAGTQSHLDALRALGCRVCLEHFGSGVCSFAHLRHLPVDAVKIDAQFLRNLHADPVNQILVRAMLDVAHGLGMATIAACVEDGETLEWLAQAGVDQVQGHHLDRPRADHPALA